jgi:hypothetical protein
MIAAGKFGEGIGNAGGYLIQTIMIGLNDYCMSDCIKF